MKMPFKPLESARLSWYEYGMRRSLLYIKWLILAALAMPIPLLAGTSAFLIYPQGANINQEASQLELSGSRIRQRIPPYILVVDLPDSLPSHKLKGPQSIFTTALPLSTLESLGPVAVAAGLQWNRGMVRTAKTNGKAMGALRVLMAQKSLPAPQNPQVEGSSPHTIRTAWQAVGGALYYELQVALDESFTNKICLTRTLIPLAEIPAAVGAEDKTVFIRIRGVDIIETVDGAREEIFGSWSSVLSFHGTASAGNESLPPPVLTSPLANHVSEGFTLHLEWIAGTAAHHRVQVSRTTDFKNTLFDTVVPTGEFTLPSPGLKVGDELFWRVQAWGVQKSPWSSVRRLEIGAPRHTHTDMFINPEVSQ